MAKIIMSKFLSIQLLLIEPIEDPICCHKIDILNGDGAY